MIAESKTQSITLSHTRLNTIINKESKVQESELAQSLRQTIQKIKTLYPQLTLLHEKHILLSEIFLCAATDYPRESSVLPGSSIRPDGGIFYLVAQDNKRYPVLISEVKKQGTNDVRVKTGIARQARGNAIERLGKNVMGLETLLHNEKIFPFVAFCYGCDFQEGSSIRDRVVTIARGAKLNTVYVHDAPTSGIKLGSYFLSEQRMSVEDMEAVCFSVIQKSIDYYFSKYGKDYFFSNK